MTFHVYQMDKYVGIVIAESTEKASAMARGKYGVGSEVVPVSYREQPDFATFIVDQYES